MKPAAPVMTTRCFIEEFTVDSSQLTGCDGDFNSTVNCQRELLTEERPPSVRMLVEKAPEKRQPHDLQIEADRPVLDVIEVVLDTLLERRVAAPPVDLRPAGESGLHLVAKHVLRNLVLELLDEMGSLRPRPDNGHVAAQHVPELRQLVE